GSEHHDRGLEALALPGDGDVAGAIGEPDGTEGEQRNDSEIDEDADHDAVGLMRGWRKFSRGESGDLGARVCRTITCPTPRANRRRGGGSRRSRPRAPAPA